MRVLYYQQRSDREIKVKRIQIPAGEGRTVMALLYVPGKGKTTGSLLYCHGGAAETCTPVFTVFSEDYEEVYRNAVKDVENAKKQGNTGRI